MFRLLRCFSLLSVLALALVALAVVFLYRSTAMGQLQQMAEARNVAVAHSVVGALRLGDLLGEGRDGAAAGARSQAAAMGAVLNDIVLEPSLLMVRLYDAAGVTVFSTHRGELGEDKSATPGFEAARRQARTTSTLQVSGGDMLLPPGDLIYAGRVVSHVPLRADGGSIRAVVEVVSDVSPWLTDVHRTQYLLVGVLLAVFGVFFALMFWVVRRADRTLAQQREAIGRHEAEHRALQEKLELQTQKRVRFERALQYSRQLQLASMPPREPQPEVAPPRRRKAQVLQFPARKRTSSGTQ